jgi:protein-tyrosine phosphatase
VTGRSEEWGGIAVEESVVVAATADEVWTVVRDVGGIGRWVPGIATVELDGDLRHVTFVNGRVQSERILGCDDEVRTCTYTHVTGPLPLEDYEARLAVVPEGAGCRVLWDATFRAPPVQVESLGALVSTTFRAALGRLARMLGEDGPSVG